MENSIAITTDCVCDLPDELLEKLGVDLIYFYIITSTGHFRDVDEITSQNIFENMADGNKSATSIAPPADEYKRFFEKKLKESNEVIHLCIGDGISMAVKNSTEAVEKMGDMGKRVHIIDSWHLSTGLGLLVIRAAEMANSGCSAEKIIDEINEMKARVSTTFLAKNADYLYNNGKVGIKVKNICSLLNFHPVLEVKEGFISLKKIEIGNYENCFGKYIKCNLKKKDTIDTRRLFITHAGCSSHEIALITKTVNKYCSFDEIIVTKASATISSNCGPHAFGILFVNKK